MRKVGSARKNHGQRRSEAAAGREKDGLPNEGVDADDGNVVQSLDSSLDLVLRSAHVADENKSLKSTRERR